MYGKKKSEYWTCLFCGKNHIKHKIKYCNCNDKVIEDALDYETPNIKDLLKMQTQINVNKKSYIHPKEMDFISYVLNSKNEFSKSQIEWYKDKILTRLSVLQPLVNECINKNLDFSIVSKDLNNEYNDLIFLKNKL